MQEYRVAGCFKNSQKGLPLLTQFPPLVLYWVGILQQLLQIAWLVFTEKSRKLFAGEMQGMVICNWIIGG